MWIVESVKANRFCKDENNSNTIYISSDADSEQNPVNFPAPMLRVSRKGNNNADQNVYKGIGQQIKEIFGSELKTACHMGPEDSIYANAMQTLVAEWNVDFRYSLCFVAYTKIRLNIFHLRQLYGDALYHSKKHMHHLRLSEHFAHVEDHNKNDPPPFAKVFEVC